MTVENISRYGIVSERTHVDPGEIEMFIAIAGLTPASNRVDGQPLYDPIQVRQVARQITRCIQHGEDRVGSFTRLPNGELSTCASCKHSSN